MQFLFRLSRILNRALMWIAGVILVLMILLTCANIFLRLVWIPIKGTFEFMGFFGAVVTAFALGYTQIERGHIAIDIVVNQFSARFRRVLNAINHFICMVFFGIAGWQLTKWATNLMRTGEVTETLRIIFYPFTYAVALGCFVLAVVMLVDFLAVFTEKQEPAG